MPQQNSNHKRSLKLIAQSKNSKPVETRIEEITQSYMYQKRNADAGGNVIGGAIRDAETAMVRKLTTDLKAHPEHTTDPVVLCRVDDALILVDGHHRLDCYKAAKREYIPSRVLTTTEAEASTLASVLNRHSSTVPQCTEEIREIAWQDVLRFHNGEQWSDGWTARKLSALFALGAKTIDRMVVARKRHGEDAVSMTWRQARSNHETREYNAAQRLAGWAKSIDKFDPQTDHEVEVLVEMLWQRLSNYETREEIAERFAPYLEDPKAFETYQKRNSFEF